jgi:cell division protein FtsW
MFRKSPYLLVFCVLFLLALGVVMLLSTGAFAYDVKDGDAFYYVKRQTLMLSLGIVACVIATLVPVRLYETLKWPILIGAVVLLAAIYVPGLGVERNGATRWLRLGVQFQPSEISKLALLIFLAAHYAQAPEKLAGPVKGLLYPFGIVLVVAGLILFQMDVGTAVLVVAMACLLMFVAGAPPLMLGSMGLLCAGGVVLLILDDPERMNRVFAFLNPEQYPQDSYQQMQGLRAFERGGWEGVGLGNGVQKLGNLPFAHTDFILPIIGEELGLRFTLAIVSMFVAIVLLGLLISSHVRERFGQLLGYGITFMIALQAAINIGVTTVVLPNKGLPLPFISYGGSNLVLCLLCVGILLRLYREGVEVKRSDPERRLLEARPIMGV